MRMIEIRIVMTNCLMVMLLVGCNGSSKNELEKLRTENIELKKELDEIKYGADKLVTEIKTSIEKKDFVAAKNYILILKEKHPNSSQSSEAIKLMTTVDDGIKKKFEAEEKEKAAKENEEKQRIANATKKMRKSHDDVKGIDWYYDKSTPVSDDTKNLHLYFGREKDGSPWLRFRIRYASDNWLFIESYIIKTDEGSHNIFTSYNEVERDNGYGGIWEWYDTKVDSNILNIVQSIIKSKNAKIRYNGKQYYHDKVITSAEKIALQNVLDAYQALGGSLNL